MNLVFITTCSQNKAGNGQEHKDRPVAASTSSELLKSREDILDSLQNSTDEQTMQGTLGDTYLLAHLLYAPGSFMGSLTAKLKNDLDQWLALNQLFFISGLYGLVDAMEPIQNYNVEMREATAKHWVDNRPLLTEELVRQLPEDPILLDCCGDPRYSNVIDWNLIGEQGVRVLHAVGPPRLRFGGQVRADAGMFAAANKADQMQLLSDETAFSGVNVGISFVSNDEFTRIRLDAGADPTAS